MERPGWLGRGLRIRVVAERVEEATLPPAQAVAHPETEDESDGVMSRRGRADDVRRPWPPVEDVVATCEQRGVRVGAVLLRPIGGRVRLVPDLDVVDQRQPSDSTPKERAVLVAAQARRRCGPGDVVDAQDDAVVELEHPRD